MMDRLGAARGREPRGAENKGYVREYGQGGVGVDQVETAFSEALAVIRCEEHRAPSLRPSRIESTDETTDPVVRAADLLGVAALVLRQER